MTPIDTADAFDFEESSSDGAHNALHNAGPSWKDRAATYLGIPAVAGAAQAGTPWQDAALRAEMGLSEPGKG